MARPGQLRPLGTGALLALCLATALTACSSDDDGGGGGGGGGGDTKGGNRALSAPKVSATPKLTSADDKGMPLDAYLLNPEQQRTLSQAQSDLVARCMNRFGFQYRMPVSDFSEQESEGRTTRVDGRFGPQSMAKARQYGYHGATSTKDPTEGWGGGDGSAKLTAQMRQVLTGARGDKEKWGAGGMMIGGAKVPDHGCLGEANKKIGGKVTAEPGTDGNFVNDIKFDTLVAAQKDKRTLAVFREWSACMAKRGYEYPDPLKAVGDPRWSKTPQATEAEKKVAVADQECRKSENVVGVWFAVDYAYQEQAVDKNAQALADVKKQNEDHLKAAADALAS
ncbi:hypothetical protein ACFY1V_03340 [Streptomyces sp. NPDC001255]|uniref:hypothetical protein n=1 Tax=Streptomyces sp. NPDC001255 TaxID=3364550 RepID=UPI0036A49924